MNKYTAPMDVTYEVFQNQTVNCCMLKHLTITHSSTSNCHSIKHTPHTLGWGSGCYGRSTFPSTTQTTKLNR